MSVPQARQSWFERVDRDLLEGIESAFALGILLVSEALRHAHAERVQRELWWALASVLAFGIGSVLRVPETIGSLLHGVRP